MKSEICLECDSEEIVGGTCQDCGSEGNQIKKGENKMSKKDLVKAMLKDQTKKEVVVAVVEEVKEIPVVKVKEEKIDNACHYEVANQIIKNEVHINPDLKIVETANASGNSYFSGRTRLFKLLKSKRGISLEINVQLSKEFCKECTGMEDISIATAHAKHLGTMKHHYRSNDSSEIMKIINAIFVTFKRNLKVVEKLETLEAKAI